MFQNALRSIPYRAGSIVVVILVALLVTSFHAIHAADFPTTEEVCGLRGTAPFCSGECVAGEVERSRENANCWTGTKAKCCSQDMSGVNETATCRYRAISGDFNGDRIADVVMYRGRSREFIKMFGSTTIGPDFQVQTVTRASVSFQWLAAVNLNDDLSTDVVSYEKNVAAFTKWYSRFNAGSNFQIQGSIKAVGTSNWSEWTNIEMISGDFNGDRQGDILFYRPTSGVFAKWYGRPGVGPSWNHQAIRALGGAAGTWSDVEMVAGDFNGDGITDVLVYRPSTGEFGKWYGTSSISPDFSYTATRAVGGTAGIWTGVKMVAADFDGDGRTDILVYRPSTGEFAKWYSDASVGPDFDYRGPTQSLTGTPGSWTSGVRMVVGDFNGDGRADVLFYVLENDQFAKYYGQPGRSPGFRRMVARPLVKNATPTRQLQMVTGDFNGDGITDILVMQGSEYSKWYGSSTISADFNYQVIRAVPGTWGTCYTPPPISPGVTPAGSSSSGSGSPSGSGSGTPSALQYGIFSCSGTLTINGQDCATQLGTDTACVSDNGNISCPAIYSGCTCTCSLGTCPNQR